MYVNPGPDEAGGHTTVPNMELRGSPRAGHAIVFNDCQGNGQEDPRTLHGGSPPSAGEKLAINIWSRAASFKMRGAGY